VRILIDTHIFLWALSEPGRLSEKRRYELETPSNLILVSAVSIAELMIKASVGRIKVEFDALEMIGKTGFEELPFRCEEAALLKDLPFHHRDPFDRMLIAQAMAKRVPIMTDDEKFRYYDCRLM